MLVLSKLIMFSKLFESQNGIKISKYFLYFCCLGMIIGLIVNGWDTFFLFILSYGCYATGVAFWGWWEDG